MAAEQIAEIFVNAFEKGALFEFRGIDADGILFIGFEDFIHAFGEGGIVNVDVALVVDAEGPVVEVDGAASNPNVVHDHDFVVELGGLIFVKLDPGIHHLVPARAGGATDHVFVDKAGRDDFDFDAALGGFNEHLNGEIVGHEIGMGKANGFAGGGDGIEIHQARVFGAIFGTAFEGLGDAVAGVWNCGEVVWAVQRFRTGANPVVHEDALDFRDDWAFDFELGVAPDRLRFGVPVPFVGDADAADEGDFSIDHERFAMSAMIPFGAIPRTDAIEDFELNAGVGKELFVFAFEFKSPKSIDDAVNFDASAGAFAESVDETIADLAGAPNEIFEGNRFLRAGDGAKHGREIFHAIVEILNFVAADHSGAEKAGNGICEGRIGDAVIGANWEVDQLVDGEAIPAGQSQQNYENQVGDQLPTHQKAEN